MGAEMDEERLWSRMAQERLGWLPSRRLTSDGWEVVLTINGNEICVARRLPGASEAEVVVDGLRAVGMDVESTVAELCKAVRAMKPKDIETAIARMARWR